MWESFYIILFGSLTVSWAFARWKITQLEELLDSYRELDDQRVKTIEGLRALFLQLGIEPKEPGRGPNDRNRR